MLSTEPAATVSVITGGSGYTSAPTCTLGAPATSTKYLSPTGGSSTQAAHRQAIARPASIREPRVQPGRLVISGTVATDWAGATVTVGATTYTLVTGAPTAANQVELYTASRNNRPTQADTAKNLEAVLNANSTSAPAEDGAVLNTDSQRQRNGNRSHEHRYLDGENQRRGGQLCAVGANNQYSDIVPTISAIGAGPGYVTPIALTAPGAGYAGGSGCTLVWRRGVRRHLRGRGNYHRGHRSYAPAFYATPGWDFATGLGSPNAYNLVFNTAW